MEEYFHGPEGRRPQPQLGAGFRRRHADRNQMDSLDSKTCTVRSAWRGRLEVVFVVTHYPAYSSAATARSMRRGALVREIRRARSGARPAHAEIQRDSDERRPRSLSTTHEIPEDRCRLSPAERRSTDARVRRPEAEPTLKFHAAVNHYSRRRAGRCVMKAFKPTATRCSIRWSSATEVRRDMRRQLSSPSWSGPVLRSGPQEKFPVVRAGFAPAQCVAIERPDGAGPFASAHGAKGGQRPP